MLPGASSYHSFTPPHISLPHYESARFTPTPHATQFHAQPPTAKPAVPLNRYIANATIKMVGDGRSVGANTKLKPGQVVEVALPGHQTQLEYATYNGYLKPLTASTLNHVPNEIRDQVKRLGGPSYFARELHNRLPTAGLYSQFNAQNFHGPNRPLI